MNCSGGAVKAESPDQVKGSSSSSVSGSDKRPNASFGLQVFNGVNRERAKRGRSTLKRDSQMDSLAASHNAHMIKQTTPHSSIETGHDKAKSRAKAIAARGVLAFAENVGGIRGYSNEAAASTLVNGWIDSPGHFKNIVGDYTHTGVAVTVDPRDGTIYATQLFAK